MPLTHNAELGVCDSSLTRLSYLECLSCRLGYGFGCLSPMASSNQVSPSSPSCSRATPPTPLLRRALLCCKLHKIHFGIKDILMLYKMYLSSRSDFICRRFVNLSTSVVLMNTSAIFNMIFYDLLSDINFETRMWWTQTEQ